MENKEERKIEVKAEPKPIEERQEIKTLRNRSLMAKLLEAEKMGSYLICLTIKDKSKAMKGNDLEHLFFTMDFTPDDFYPCLDEYAKMLEREKLKHTPNAKG